MRTSVLLCVVSVFSMFAGCGGVKKKSTTCRGGITNACRGALPGTTYCPGEIVLPTCSDAGQTTCPAGSIPDVECTCRGLSCMQVLDVGTDGIECADAGDCGSDGFT